MGIYSRVAWLSFINYINNVQIINRDKINVRIGLLFILLVVFLLIFSYISILRASAVTFDSFNNANYWALNPNSGNISVHDGILEIKGKANATSKFFYPNSGDFTISYDEQDIYTPTDQAAYGPFIGDFYLASSYNPVIQYSFYAMVMNGAPSFPTAPYNLGNWHHNRLDIFRSNNTVKLYMDYTLVSSRSGAIGNTNNSPIIFFGQASLSHFYMDNFAMSDQIGELPLNANFTSNTTSGLAPLTIQFNDTSAGYPTNRSWDFRDGKNSTEQNPCHIYNRTGTYTVTLTVSNFNGINTISKPDYIRVKTLDEIDDFVNGDFESGPLGWTFGRHDWYYDAASYNVVDRVDENYPHTGSKSLDISMDKYLGQWEDSWGVYQEVNLTGATSISFWMNGYSKYNVSWVEVMINQAGTPSNGQYYACRGFYINNSAVWQKQVFNITSYNLKGKYRVWFLLCGQGISYGNEHASAYIDDIHLIGAKPLSDLWIGSNDITFKKKVV